MPTVTGKLSTLEIKNAKKTCSDGGNLYLQVDAKGNKSWLFRYMIDGKAKNIGLGPLHAIKPNIAREQAEECRKLLKLGTDPLEARKLERQKARAAAAKTMPFKQCAEAYIAAHKAGWRNAKHASQWPSTLKKYVYPVFGDVSVQDVDVSMIMKVLEPIWTTKTETATRVRSRIELVLDWAKAREYRTGDNPARWRDHLKNLLANPSKIRRVRHHPSLPYEQVGDFMIALKQQGGTAAFALQFTVLTGSRTSEVIHSTWDEFDLQNKVWVLQDDRTKSNRMHRVPLSEPAIRILKEMKKQQELIQAADGESSKWVFPGLKSGKPLSNMAMLALRDRMNRQDITVHGFRSTFRTWAAEQTNYPREVAEGAISHAIGDTTEMRYLRTDFLEKRERMMKEWAKHCETPSVKDKGKGKVIKFSGRR